MTTRYSCVRQHVVRLLATSCECHNVPIVHIYHRSMNRDPAHFADPDEFKPDRYLNSSGELVDDLPYTHGIGHMSFGSGRRYVSA